MHIIASADIPQKSPKQFILFSRSRGFKLFMLRVLLILKNRRRSQYILSGFLLLTDYSLSRNKSHRVNIKLDIGKVKYLLYFICEC
jgi:hypothetical protein